MLVEKVEVEDVVDVEELVGEVASSVVVTGAASDVHAATTRQQRRTTRNMKASVAPPNTTRLSRSRPLERGGLTALKSTREFEERIPIRVGLLFKAAP